MLCEIADLGFTHAELSHGIRIVLVPGVLRAVEEGLIKISSTHNFCPLPAGVTQSAPNLFEPSATDHREHDQWLRHTKRSLDFAAQVKARVCVLHLGSVRFWFFPPSRKVQAYLRDNPGAETLASAKYQALLSKAGVKLRGRMGSAWTQTLASLGEIDAYARERGVLLGCENREKFEELPLDDDFGVLFESLSAGGDGGVEGAVGAQTMCGYWHDTGHARIKEGMGLLNHREHLEKNAARLLGFHLHDVNAKGKDHQPVGSGEIDFEMVSRFWRPEHLLTLELGPRITMEGVVSSKRRVEDLISRRYG
jgi:sugar phosphate isomerase/epimerase